MLKSELLELIANGESSGVEFKRDDVRPEQLAKEIVALANFQGGQVLLGVGDDGTIGGLTRDDTERWVRDVVFSRYVHPMILPFYEEVVLEEGQRVAAWVSVAGSVVGGGVSGCSNKLRMRTPSASRIRLARSTVMLWYSFRSSRET